ncbi:2-oxo-3-deoxygalactonate kinase [Klebsiella pneumoniae subsp. pneumoniae]|uniref:2-oxo-3-deoxygalactonate kinase n=1 Tax=Klebsiella pneumoniae subsp. pneumoniae TaxID=72407 RepID=A0A378AJR6_KLEPN|nr:2-oxo-3-deoxygalactonate kinase [Klebsiella pneumoniae subsp. pneumoniae]
MKDYIAVDWGSTQLRGWLIRNGQCVETKQLPMGITRLNGRSPADVFAEHLAPWRGAQALPVLMAGMIGSDAAGKRCRIWTVRRRSTRLGGSYAPLLKACGLYPASRLNRTGIST